MSPDITPIIRPTGAARICADAINAAYDAGLTVSTAADLGVVVTSSAAPRWEVDPRATAVSVLGCVLLAKQPPFTDENAALSAVFSSRPEFHKGIEDGVAGRLPALTDSLYKNGLFIGVQLRVLVSTVPCALHMIRHPRGEKCPRCAAGVPVERPGGEVTGPMQIDTPRSVIAELISSLTASQVLEALADSIPGRGWGADESADAVIELHALADDYRSRER